MKNRQYWKERFEILQESQMAKGEEYYRELDKQYRKSMNEIESQMARWYGRIAENNEINMSQARKWLKGKELEEFKWTVEEYIQHGKQNSINPIWLKELENASARAHISRLEALKIQLQQTVESLYQSQNIGLSNALRRIYEDGYYRSAFEIQRGLNVGWAIPALDSARVTQILSKPWTADGSNFSDRIWKAKGDLVNTLHTELTQSIIMGRAPDKAIKRIAEKFNTSRTRAGRLVMTESAFFASASQRDCFNDLDVEKYEILATLDNKTSEICQELDGKVFKMSEYEPGLTAPPFHCWCRTTTIPHFDDNFGERIARDESGRQYYVSDDMIYSDWKKEYVKNNVLNSRNSGIMNNINWLRLEFPTTKKFEKHLEKHLDNYPGLTPEQYLQRAQELLSAELSDNIEGFIDKDGFLFKYDKINNDFAIGRPDGKISTLFKPEDGNEYWKGERVKYEPKN